MRYDVFVSYASQDNEVAQQVRGHLEGQGLRCWFAPKSIGGGQSFPVQIVEGIRNCRVLLVLVSPECNRSPHTEREIILADNEGLSMLPVRIRDFVPWSTLRYFLANCQWIDAAAGPIDGYLDLIAETVKSLLSSPWRREASGQVMTGPLPAGVKPGSTLGIEPYGAYLPLKRPRPGLDSQQPSLWLQAYQSFIPMINREGELESLKAFLSEEGFFRWQVIIGEGGIGKTRLAMEFAEQALAAGWHAGMLDGHGLKLFLQSPGFGQWRPMVPTLIVVDYAASKAEGLSVLLQQLADLDLHYLGADQGDRAGATIRVLLIERHGEETCGWLQTLLQSGEGQVKDRLQKPCYRGLTELLPPHSRDSEDQKVDAETSRLIIQSTFESWARVTGRAAPGLPDFSMEDWRRIQINTLNRPLYLQMAAIHACEAGTADYLPLWGRGELIWGAVDRELEYIQRLCGSDGDLLAALNHTAAILCIGGIGLAQSGRQWQRILREEIQDITDKYSTREIEGHRKAIFHEPITLSGDAETGLIQPDIVSEGFAATILLREQREFHFEPVETLDRIIEWTGLKGWSNLIRLVQDLHGIPDYVVDGRTRSSFEGVEQWPLSLVDSGSCRPESLRELSEIIPERTESVRALGLRVHEILVQETSVSDEEKAGYLIKLATHRHRGNPRDAAALRQALGEAEEAIELLRKTIPGKDPLDRRLVSLAKAHRESGWILDDLQFLDPDPAILASWTRHDLLGALASLGRYPEDPGTITGQIAEARLVLEAPAPEDTQFLSEYADCLNNLTLRYRTLNDPPFAYALICRAVECGRKLVAVNWTLYAPQLARYLNNLAISHNELGRIEEAIASETESITIRREFLCKRPDEYAEPLILSLETLRSLLYGKGNLREVFQTLEEIINLLLDLAARNPHKFRPQLAYKYHDAGYFCYQNGEFEKGLSYTEKGLEIFRELYASEGARYLEDLIRIYTNLIAFHSELQQYAQTVCRLEEKYALLSENRKRNPQMQVEELVQTTRQLSEFSRLAGQDEAAQKWRRVYYDYAEEDVLSDPIRIGREQHDQAESLMLKGRAAEAAEAMEVAVRFFQKALARCDRETDVFEFAKRSGDLSSALVHLGDWKSDADLLEKGGQVARTALEGFAPETEDSSYTYGALCHNLGHALYRRGEIASDVSLVCEGISFLETSLGVFEKHAEAYSFKYAIEKTRGLLEAAQGVKKRLSSVDFL